MTKSVKVLLADHDAQIRKRIVRAFLNIDDLEIANQAENSYDTITKAIRLKPDVILMNVQADANSSGIFVCKTICSNLPGAYIILYDESGSKENIILAFQMGATNVLSGAFTDDDLIESVRDAGKGCPSIHASAAETLRQEFRRISSLQDNLTYLLNVMIRLTPGEMNVLRLLYSGMSYKEVMRILFISSSTMKSHISHILKKFDQESMAQVMEVLHSTQLFSLISPASLEEF